MKVSRERLIEELAHYIVEVRELREENMSLRKELESFSEERIVIETRESEEEELERKLSMTIYDENLNFSELFKRIPISKLWGIGNSYSFILNNYGVKTIYDFICINENLL